jgi:hypothetical protein
MGTATATVMATGTATTGKNPRVARLKLTRRTNAFGLALTLWDVWRRLPPRQRRWVFKQARKHGPRVAKQVVAAQRARKKR